MPLPARALCAPFAPAQDEGPMSESSDAAGHKKRYRTGKRRKLRSDPTEDGSSAVRAEHGSVDALTEELGLARGSSGSTIERPETWSQVTLGEWMLRVPWQTAADLSVPSFDPTRTELVGPMPAAVFVRLIDVSMRCSRSRRSTCSR